MFKLGRRRPATGFKALHLKDYLKPELPAPPKAVNWGIDCPVLSEMLLNDQLKNCLTASVMHLSSILNDDAGRPTTFTNEQAEAFYSLSTGYVPGDPSTDLGGDEITVLDCWKNNGLLANGEHKVISWLLVDGTNQTEVMTAIYLFGGLIATAELPNEWVNPFPSVNGFEWPLAGNPNPDNGYSFVVKGFFPGYVTLSAWNLIGHAPFAAVPKYMTPAANGGLYAVLSQDWQSNITAKAPNGINISQLESDIALF